MSAVLMLASLGPNRLVLPESTAAQDPGSPLVIALVVGLMVFIAVGGAVLVLTELWGRLEPEERAFRRLCARMRLSRRDRRAIREAAVANEVDPVVLLICPNAIAPEPGSTQLASVG